MPFTNASVPKLSGATQLLKYCTNKGLPERCHLHMAKSILDVLGSNYSSFLRMTLVESFPIFMLVAHPFLSVVFELNVEAPNYVTSSRITYNRRPFMDTDRISRKGAG
ncbi:hypothetical protein BT93_L3348 [Corymbia citriodora subsp. variegata]|uniref:Uncharacterized protein n=1 Tax=Corymbia citriodora subsp. variegata TaxID=360336 RepID=A0A8T0CLT1_CORYI|nr:hypothetical protein BT93_L3348 [Corymbia citriodora subsp. variegata]